MKRRGFFGSLVGALGLASNPEAMAKPTVKTPNDLWFYEEDAPRLEGDDRPLVKVWLTHRHWQTREILSPEGHYALGRTERGEPAVPAWTYEVQDRFAVVVHDPVPQNIGGYRFGGELPSPVDRGIRQAIFRHVGSGVYLEDK